jgi:type IV secretion system protein TrbI
VLDRCRRGQQHQHGNSPGASLGAANSLNQTGQQVVRRNLNIQPTLTIRPGFPVRVIVNRDLVLEPYRG